MLLSLPKKQEVDPFPIHFLPKLLRDLAENVSEVYRVPVEFPAMVLIGLNSALFGKGIELHFREYRTRTNLFMVLTLPSGSGKSKTMNLLAKPIRAFESEKYSEWEGAKRPELMAEKEILEQEVKHALKSKKTPGSVLETSREQRIRDVTALRTQLAEIEKKSKNPNVFTCDDVSQEKAVEIMGSNGETLLFLTSEAGRTIDNLMGRMNSKGTPDDAHLLAAYTGDTYKCDRLSRETIHLEDPCGSLLWSLTPDRLKMLLGNHHLMTDGFLARSLLCSIDVQPREEMLGEAQKIDSEPYQAWVCHCKIMLEGFRKWQGAPATLTCDGEDVEFVFTDYYNQQLEEYRKQDPKLHPFISRRRENALRLALGFHMAEYGCDGAGMPVSHTTAHNACAIIDWVSRQQMYVLKGAQYRDKQEKILKAEKLARDLATDGKHIVPSDLRRKRRIEDDPDRQMQILETLVEKGSLIREMEGLRPTGRYSHFTLKLGKSTQSRVTPANDLGDKTNENTQNDQEND